MARVGILGLPNAGKTTLFNALTGLAAPTAPHAFSTTEPNIGVAKVPDARLDAAARLEGSPKVVHAGLDLLDLPAMGAEESSFAARFIGNLREMDALAVVLRSFEDESVVGAGTDPVDQAETLLLELALADAEVFRKRADRAAKEASADAGLRVAAEGFLQAAAMLEEGVHLRTATWSESHQEAFRDLAPLTLKPAVWVVNVGEDDLDPEGRVAAVAEVVPAGDEVVALSARIEEEAALLDPADRAELLAGLGLGEGALARVVAATYSALGLISFFTVGPKESRAWTVRRGATAPVAAGKIHSDLQRGFIRAEVAGIDEVVAAGGWDAAKAAGLHRVEGKDYIVAEGDVLLVRFSV